VVERDKTFAHIVGHQEVDFLSLIIPCNGKSAVLIAFPVS
jgi:hypothetical protein